VSITFSGVDSIFQADSTYTMTVNVNNPNQARFGFEMTALDGNNTKAGSFTVLNANNTSLQTAGGREYVGHNNANPNDQWQFEWTAPDSCVDSVTFYAAGNATNSNGVTTGDTVYTTSLTIHPDTTSVITDFAADRTSGCTGDTIQFTDLSTGNVTQWDWDFGTDAQPPSAATEGPHYVVYDSGGLKSVELIASNGCSTDTLTRTDYINLVNVATAFNQSDDTISTTDTVFFQNNSTAADSFLWEFGDGSTLWTTQDTAVSHIYTNCDTTLPVRLTAYQDSCQGIAASTVTIEGVTAAFTATPDTIGNGETVTFQNNTPSGDSYLWDFGDGTSLSTTEDTAVQHTYGVPAPSGSIVDTSFTVQLSVNKGPCADLASALIVMQDTIEGVEPAPDHALQLYPNPATDHLYIEIGEGSSQQWELRIRGTKGSIQWKKSLVLDASSTRVQLPDLSPGLYFIELGNGDRTVRQKFVYEE
jgi:PKD repeat protein